ncbi:MAG: hypothetical protein L0Y72_30475 [Gemmataceae bacterium]|nr:hypothetical protein [Gemmataceae bacterium]MCI0743374.1 hypothetical protein [Gemmataceae bacterium]
MAETDRPTLLVFADDWGRHPSSCQHLVRRLLDRYQVYWVNTIGMRAPRLDVATIQRGIEKLRHWVRRPVVQPRPAEEAHGRQPADADAPRVLNPRMWPRFTSRWERKLNRELLTRQLNPLLRSLPTPPVAVTTLPIVADLMDRMPVKHWVYYCVDDFGQWPGLDQEVLQRMEEVVIRRAHRLIAVSETLQERIARRGRSADLLTHGVDIDFWSSVNPRSTIHQLENLERPLIVFWGVVDRRMDLAFVQCLAERLTRGTIVLAGPEADPDPRLLALPRVARLAPLPYEQLPTLGREAAVLIMPYADLPVTRAIQPLKLKEYLATGRPTVVRNLPATSAWGDCADVTDSPAEFAAAVCQRLETGLPDSQSQARARLSRESWDEKATLFEQWAIAREPILHASA